MVVENISQLEVYSSKKPFPIPWIGPFSILIVASLKLSPIKNNKGEGFEKVKEVSMYYGSVWRNKIVNIIGLRLS